MANGAKAECSAQDKRRSLPGYGFEHHQPGTYEIDHLISIGLGGSTTSRTYGRQSLDDTKLWNAKRKDRLERRLHVLLCTQSHAEPSRRARCTRVQLDRAYRKYIGER